MAILSPVKALIDTVLPDAKDLGNIDTHANSYVPLDSDEADIGSLICFDSIYDELARDSTRSGAQVLTISTNDSWFMDSAALDMHNAQAKLRAIENGRYVVRAANTGISSVISPTGAEISSIGALSEGQITEEVGLRDNLTLYTRIGNLFVYICIAFIGGAVLVNTFKAFRKKAKAD